ncbi:MAG: TldD/PmbA family protein [Acidobacteriota bacterium]
MSKDQTEILESNRQHLLRIRPGSIKEYSYRERNGFIRRESGKEQILESGEFRGRNELIRSLPGDLKKKFFPAEEKGFLSSSASFSKNGLQLSSFLNKVSGLEWEIIFKVLSKRKFVKKKGKDKGSTEFSHHSVLIRFKKKEWRNFIEIGEGNTDGSPHNISGLLNRLDDIMKCNLGTSGKSLPGGIPLILSPGEGGIVFHEILGHSLETDHIQKGLSPFSISDIGRKVVSGNITLSTYREGDPFFENVGLDDEGSERNRSVLIEKGVLRHFISDRPCSENLGISDNGSARMEDFSMRPMPRMFSIYLENGGYSHKEIMASTEKGIFAKEFGDGKVLFHKNKFYFNIPSAYMIRKGKIGEPLGSIVVSGKVDEVFNSVEMVGDDFSLDRGISYCYKDGQTLNVRVGQPSVKINKLNFSRGLNDI